MTKGPEQACQKACRIHGCSHAGPHDSAHVIPDVSNPLLSFPTFSIPLLSFPTFSIGNPWLFPCRTTNEGTEEKDTGFPLKTGGNDRGGPAGWTEGDRQDGQRGPSGPFHLLTLTFSFSWRRWLAGRFMMRAEKGTLEGPASVFRSFSRCSGCTTAPDWYILLGRQGMTNTETY